LKNKQNFIKYLNISNIETRPIISGNFLNQPSAKLYKLDRKPKKFKISQEIEDRGFFIGLPTKLISKKTLKYLSEKLLNIDKL
jgi:CDP-6-deoxy-D-xylo-4-hexulose-3-dehydrase